MADHLVTTAWLHAHLTDAAVRVVDIRGRVLPADAPLPHYYARREAYMESHIPGAVFVDWTQDIVAPGSPSRDVAAPERFEEAMRSRGISADTRVIAYDDADGMFAARLWWALRYYGHEHVSVLDGGWKKWTTEGRPGTAALPQVPRGSFVAHPVDTLRRTADEVASRSADTVLIDVRTPDEFAGRTSRAARAGHIPGAVNVPRGRMVRADGTLHDPDTLRNVLLEAGLTLDPGQEVITYCNAGVSASFGLLALSTLGWPGAVYDGSWKDWGNDESRPIA